MIGGRSSSESSNTSTVDTTNLNLQDVEGLTIAGNRGPVSLQLSDQGAIEAGRDIAELGIGAFRDNVDLTRDIINASAAQSESIAGLASSVLSRESTNTEPRLEAITKTALLVAGGIVAVIIFTR